MYKPKKYYIKTLGCQANIADSNLMCGILENLGFEEYDLSLELQIKHEHEQLMDIFKNVDLFIINTCSVRQKSEDKAYGVGKILKDFSELYLLSNKPFIIMSGCMVGSVTGERVRYKFAELEKKTPWVDAYISPNQILDIPSILEDRGLLDEWLLNKIKIDNKDNYSNIFPKQRDKDHAFVNISFGCDNFCSYCVVPYSRGREVHRSKEEIISEIKNLTKLGIHKITLCGQNVNSWGLSMSEKFDVRSGSSQKLPFASLIREVHDIDGIEVLDFLSSNPFDFTQDLIDVLSMPKISNYIHIAVQSGNNDVLLSMNRRHTVEDFIDLINKIKDVRPEMEFGTDIIVGFPGETREQFMDTVDLFNKISFSVAFISMYSPRVGTPAQKLLKDDISLKEKKYRHAYLTKVWKQTKLNNK